MQMTEKQLSKAIKDASKAFDADIRALKKAFIHEVSVLQKQVDESAARSVRSSLRKSV
ncbi:MAG: hypothetical protein Q8P56_01665 [Candidatus Uhrbacteria bacterium]|nr:hypothetical protein [Candidatus Uhrbacteria bacterium]